MNELIGGKCDWQGKIIWINDAYVHAGRKDKMHAGKIKDIFSLDPGQRFTMILNHEVFHAVHHERIDNIIAMVTMSLFPFFIVDLFLLHWIFTILIAMVVFVAVVVLLHALEENLACKHGENYTTIDKEMLARLT
jgi:hypothetical protein